jgi:hypothetical protein
VYFPGDRVVRGLKQRPAALGYRDDEQVCIVTVGGSGVGSPLLRRVIDAYPLARDRVPGLRMIVVVGPRIDPDSLPHHDGLEVRAYVPDLYRHLAVVQGGLTTTMELVELWASNPRPLACDAWRSRLPASGWVWYRLVRQPELSGPVWCWLIRLSLG